MSNISTRRILSDINSLNSHPLDNEGIYWHLDEDNIYNFKALIIGPKDTPYEGGFYFFEFNIPQTYPIDPPKTKYRTQFNNIRFNPNLYTNGTVCLSILNTWNGPSWTPCNTLTSLLMSILGLVFVKHPLTNEPGYEDSSINILDQYNSIIEHESLRGACLYILENIPYGFEVFKDKIEKYFIDHYSEYIEKICNLMQIKHNKNFICGTYNMKLITNYDNILKKFQNMYEKLTGIIPKTPMYLPNISNINVKELKELAKKMDIDIKKNGKNKLKNELYNDVDTIIKSKKSNNI